MTVKELIKILEEVENKDKSVCIYDTESDRVKIIEHYDIDLNINDRLDFNY